ncbi:MAG: methyltransferase, partial [Candidatus Krumholzibacteria bacterium]|nr:methyltransferase [Candidatus Krumholzibacteria bacterium]
LDTVRDVPEPIDMVFIDADKKNYVHYWEACVPKVRTGGILIADNVLWSGRVLKPSEPDDHALAAFNGHVTSDTRVESVMLPIRDGITLATRI